MARPHAIAARLFGERAIIPRVRATPQRSTLEWLPGLISAAVRLIDCAILLVAAVLVHKVYLGQAPGPAPQQFYILAALASLVQLNIFHFWGLYTFKRLSNINFQISNVLLATFVLFLVVVATLYITKTSAIYSRGWMLLWFVATAGGLLAFRIALCPVTQYLLRRGSLLSRVAMIGCGQTAERLVGYLRAYQGAHLQIVGIFDDRATVRDSMTLIRPSGTVDQLCRLARMRHIDAIIVVLPNISEDRLHDILSRLSSLPVDVRLCRETLEYCMPQSSYEFYGIIPLLRLLDKPVSRWGSLAKTIEDKVLATILLILLGPLMLVIAVRIKLDSPGPVLFKQRRYGFNNRLITVWKFRTMYHDQADADAERQTTKDDPRVTPFGRFLRRTSLDELPQLINVLLGDMSMVGPRPHAVATKAGGELFETIVKQYAARHRVKPGITGWAQVKGWRGETDTVEKIRGRVSYDLYYIDNWSPMFDIKILLMTSYIVFNRKNAY